MATSDEFLPYLQIFEDMLRPLFEAVEDFDAAENLLVELGYAPPSQVLAFSELGAVVNAVVILIDAVRTAADTDDTDELLKQLASLIPQVTQAIKAINTFQTKIQQNFAGSPFLTETDILTEIPRKLAEYLIVVYLENYHPTVFAILL